MDRCVWVVTSDCVGDGIMKEWCGLAGGGVMWCGCGSGLRCGVAWCVPRGEGC